MRALEKAPIWRVGARFPRSTRNIWHVRALVGSHKPDANKKPPVHGGVGHALRVF